MGLKRKRLSSGLVGHWLTDTSDPATAPDHSGNLNHGTITGATWTTGTTGRGLLFNGIGDFVDVGNGTSLNVDTSSFTLSAWVFSEDDINTLAIAGKVTYANPSWGIYQTSGKFRFQRRGVTSGTDAIANSAYTASTWYHVAGVRNNTVNELYINGVLQSTTATNTDTIDTSGTTFKIGRSTVTNTYLKGIIDDTRFWNRALSAAEMFDVFAKGRQRHGI